MANLADLTGDVGSNLVQGTGTRSATFTMPGNVAINVESVVATITNGAATAITPQLTIKDAAGVVIATKRQGETIPAADSGTATFALRLGDNGGGGGISKVTLIDFVDFNPVAGFIQVTSILPGTPTTIATSSAITYDGLTQIELLFYAAAMDIDQRGIGNTNQLNLELYRDTTALGIIGGYNVYSNTYGSIPCYLSAFDTPSAGSHTYSIRGYVQGGGGGAVGPTFIYGSNVTTPHATRPGYLAILEAVVV